MTTLHTERAARVLDRVRGGCEGTTTGVLRLRRMAAEGALAFPVIAASDTPVNRLVDNTHGTGAVRHRRAAARQRGPARGQDRGGRGVRRLRGRASPSAPARLGARVVITEVDPVRALDAVLRGFRVLPLADAAPLGEVFITATGTAEVITAEHLAVMRDGAVLANAGHFDVEIDVRALARLAVAVHPDVRPHATPRTAPTAAACCCSPKAAWSTSSPPTGTRPR